MGLKIWHEGVPSRQCAVHVCANWMLPQVRRITRGPCWCGASSSGLALSRRDLWPFTTPPPLAWQRPSSPVRTQVEWRAQSCWRRSCQCVRWTCSTNAGSELCGRRHCVPSGCTVLLAGGSDKIYWRTAHPLASGSLNAHFRLAHPLKDVIEWDRFYLSCSLQGHLCYLVSVAS